MKAPTRYIPVGEEFTRYGIRLRCVPRPRNLTPADACKGCWFSKGRRSVPGEGYIMTNCNDIQCSCFDRMDGNFVWFQDADAQDELKDSVRGTWCDKENL